jgi:prephenate dehydrogenase
MSLAIVGLGLIGTSVALAARRRWPNIRILGVDRPEALLHPTIVHVCDLASPDPAVAREADVVVLAAPVDVILALMPAIARVARADALVMDVGSTKRAIVAAAQALGVSRFVGGHPMAGAEVSGPGAARSDLFDARPWFLVPASDAPDRSRADAFVESLGAVPVWTDAASHDRLMAAVSHLPQVVASALMVTTGNATGDEGLRWAGAGLRDTTRLAASTAPLWESVLASNHDELQPLLLRLADELRAIAYQLANPNAVREVFDAANRYRTRLDQM